MLLSFSTLAHVGPKRASPPRHKDTKNLFFFFVTFWCISSIQRPIKKRLRFFGTKAQSFALRGTTRVWLAGQAHSIRQAETLIGGSLTGATGVTYAPRGISVSAIGSGANFDQFPPGKSLQSVAFSPCRAYAAYSLHHSLSDLIIVKLMGASNMAATGQYLTKSLSVDFTPGGSPSGGFYDGLL
jgi:hypothetical protein